MKTDIKGCSITLAGKEQYEYFKSVSDKHLVQYDYRTPAGELFSCVALALDAAREKRDAWLKQRGQ